MYIYTYIYVYIYIYIYVRPIPYTIIIHKNESKITPYEDKNVFSRLL